MSTAAEVAAAAGPGVGTGIGLWGAFRFVRWLVEFIWKRMDVRNARLDAKEKALEERYDARLDHVERELTSTRRAMMLLLNDVARRDPANPVLQRVADLLHPVFPATESDPAMENLTRRAGEALDAAD